MRILVTGFEPFGGDAENASAEVVARVAAHATGRHEVVTHILPVSFDRAPRELRSVIDEQHPDVVLCIGEAGGRAHITPETRGWNRMNARIPDNDGAAPQDEPIDDGPDTRRATLDVSTLVEAIRAVGLPAELSDDPGLFVCNRIAHAVATLDVPGAFIHVPAVRSTGTAGVGAETDDALSTDSALSFDDLARGIGAAISAAAST